MDSFPVQDLLWLKSNAQTLEAKIGDHEKISFGTLCWTKKDLVNSVKNTEALYCQGLMSNRYICNVTYIFTQNFKAIH